MDDSKGLTVGAKQLVDGDDHDSHSNKGKKILVNSKHTHHIKEIINPSKQNSPKRSVRNSTDLRNSGIGLTEKQQNELLKHYISPDDLNL